MLGRGGLGYNPQIGSDGVVVDCDSWSNLFQGVCWNPFAESLPVQAVTDTYTGQTRYQPVLSPTIDPTKPLLSSLSAFTPFLPWIAIGLGAYLVIDMVRGRRR